MSRRPIARTSGRLHVVAAVGFSSGVTRPEPTQEERNDEKSLCRAWLCLSSRPRPPAQLGRATPRHPILDSYIVVLKPDAARSAAALASQRPLVATVAQELGRAHGGAVTSVYQYALKGFAVRLSAEQAEALANDPRVEYVEADQVVRIVRDAEPGARGGSTGSTSATCR